MYGTRTSSSVGGGGVISAAFSATWVTTAWEAAAASAWDWARAVRHRPGPAWSFIGIVLGEDAALDQALEEIDRKAGGAASGAGRRVAGPELVGMLLAKSAGSLPGSFAGEAGWHGPAPGGAWTRRAWAAAGVLARDSRRGSGSGSRRGMRPNPPRQAQDQVERHRVAGWRWA